MWWSMFLRSRFQPAHFAFRSSWSAGDAKDVNHENEWAIVFTFRPVESASPSHYISVSSGLQRPMRSPANGRGHQFIYRVPGVTSGTTKDTIFGRLVSQKAAVLFIMSNVHWNQHQIRSEYVIAIISHLFDPIHWTNSRLRSTIRRTQTSNDNDDGSELTRLDRMKLTCTARMFTHIR